MRAAVFQTLLPLLFITLGSCTTSMTSPGHRQSPIDINTSRASKLRGINKPPLTIYYHYPDNSRVRVYKDTNTVKLVPETISNQFLLSGGPLKGDVYNFNELHFHWGVNNDEGSEHTINKTRFSMEAHLVFYKLEYGSPAEAARQPDGYVVIGLLIEAGGDANSDFQSITDIVNRSTASDEPFMVTAAEAYTWFVKSLEPDSKYYTYLGSLTTSPFTENVRWVVFDFVVTISSQQIQPFRQLTYQGRELTPNFRETQPLNSRRVFYSRSYTLNTL